MVKRSTSTSAFGVSKRESHDASGFYRRFVPPDLSSESAVAAHRALDKLIVGDARCMDEVPDSSVALVVTSPPYFAGKEYEEVLGESGVPATYLEYLDLLRDVFRQCVRKLEPGGRIAVNVANLILVGVPTGLSRQTSPGFSKTTCAYCFGARSSG